MIAIVMLIGLMPAVYAADGPGYRLEGKGTEDGYDIVIKAPGVDATGGQLAVQYDTGKLRLLGGDALKAVSAASGVTLARDHVEETELVNGDKGVVGFAWYSFGLTNEEVATLHFGFENGSTAADLDASSIRLRYVPAEGFGAWDTAAKLHVRTGGYAPDTYGYLNEAYREISVEFAYDGAEKAPEAADVTVHCRDLLGKGVAARMEIDTRGYTTDSNGDVRLPLGDGEYLYRVTAEGFGTQMGKLTVSGKTEQTITFVTDELLVEQARAQLEIGYNEGDTAEAVAHSLTLKTKTESGVNVAWSSGNTSRVSNYGAVFRPASGSGNVKVELTATLSHGSARAEKKFTVTVLEMEAQSKPATGVSGGGTAAGTVTTFRDVTDTRFGWAKEAIEALAAAGVIHGTGDGKFSPEAPIKRGDFMLLLMGMIPTEVSPSREEFSDVPAESYYHEAIQKARALGVAEGTGGNRFSPDASITRQEMAVLTVRILEKTGYVTLTEATGDLNTYKDAGEIAPWAEESLALLTGQGYLVGSENALKPGANTNRAEAAVFLYGIYKAHGR